MKNLIFVFILFATLLTVNAFPYHLFKRTTQFGACSGSIIKVDVTIDPDPLVAGQNAKFDVSGTLDDDITAGTTILGIAFADTAKNPIGDPYVQVFDTSYKAKSPFSIEAPSVPVPSNLPKDYLTAVVVGDPTDDPNNPLDVYGCAFAST